MEEAIEASTFLTMDQALKDIVRFAQSVEMPIENPQKDYSPDESPWVAIGCSYPGTLAAMLQRYHPGTFAAYYASSAPLHTFDNYWQYWVPVEAALPRNCSSDVKLLVNHLDDLNDSGTRDDIDHLLTYFNNSKSVSSLDDVALRLREPFQTWQVYDSVAFEFCDALEGYMNRFPDRPHDIDFVLESLAAWEVDFVHPISAESSEEFLKSLTEEELADIQELYFGPLDMHGWTWIQCVRATSFETFPEIYCIRI